MEIAKVVSQCIFFPAHMAKVNFWFHWTSVIFNDNTYFFIFLIYTKLLNEKKEGGFMVFNATFNNILVILWWSVLLMEETWSAWRKPPNLPWVADKLYHSNSTLVALQNPNHNFQMSICYVECRQKSILFF
jgi:hypothetical protein